MTRSLLIGLTAIVALMVLSGTGCQSTGVGNPCTPGQEYTQSFLGFDEGEVSVEALSFQCQTRLCLVNHLRAACPARTARTPTAPPSGDVGDPPMQPRGRQRGRLLCGHRRAGDRHRGRTGGPDVGLACAERRRHVRQFRRNGHRSTAVHQPVGRRCGLLLVPVCQRQWTDQRRIQLLHLPDGLRLHPARELDRRQRNQVSRALIASRVVPLTIRANRARPAIQRTPPRIAAPRSFRAPRRNEPGRGIGSRAELAVADLLFARLRALCPQPAARRPRDRRGGDPRRAGRHDGGAHAGAGRLGARVRKCESVEAGAPPSRGGTAVENAPAPTRPFEAGAHRRGRRDIRGGGDARRIRGGCARPLNGRVSTSDAPASVDVRAYSPSALFMAARTRPSAATASSLLPASSAANPASTSPSR